MSNFPHIPGAKLSYNISVCCLTYSTNCVYLCKKSTQICRFFSAAKMRFSTLNIPLFFTLTNSLLLVKMSAIKSEKILGHSFVKSITQNTKKQSLVKIVLLLFYGK